MNRTQLRTLLVSLDLSGSPDEAQARDRMVPLLDTTPDCFFRTSFPLHFTASALVVSSDGTRGLFTHHRALNRWLQLGGHCDGEEDPLSVAMREAWEESGIERLNPTSREPIDFDIHTIPAHKDEPPHEHCDIRFLFVAPLNAVAAASHESHELRWLTPEEILETPIDPGLRRLVGKWKVLRDGFVASLRIPEGLD